VFIFLFLICAVFAYLGWKGYSEATQRADSLDATLVTTKDQVGKQQTIIEDHQERMGFGRSDNPESVKTAFEADMKAYGAGVADEGSWFYRKVLEAVSNEARQTAGRETALKNQVGDLTKTMQALENQKAAEIAKIDEARQKVATNAAAAETTFLEDRKKMEKSVNDLMAKVDQQKDEFDTKAAAWQTEKTALEKEVGKLTDATEILKAGRKDEPGSFEFADGRISWVNQNGTVWINLGTADSLRRQVTFSVYDYDQHDAAKASKKGSIEVTRLLGPHMAEAKVTEDDSNNPILTGDNIYSQVWHRGKRLHFALTGFIDVDGDGRSDMQLARELIEMNDGIVDAYLKDDGTTEGEITANTRYLVLGDAPESVLQGKLLDGWNSMSQDASKYGVESVTLAEFLGQMGYKPQDRSVTLGTGATARDFPARPEDESAPVSAPRFRARTPYKAPALPPQ